MDRSGIKSMGWGSPTKRPHSWVTAYDGTPSYHQGAGRYRDDVSDSRSQSGQYNARDSPVTQADGYRNSHGTEDRHGDGKAALRNLRCRSLIEDSDDLYKMYEHPPPPSQAGNNRVAMYSYPANSNHRYLSNGNANHSEQYRQSEINSNFYGPHQYIDSYPSSKYTTYGIDPYDNGTTSTGPVYHCNNTKYGSNDHRQPNNSYRYQTKYRDNQNNNPHLDNTVNQIDWSPEKASSSGSSFDSGYHSTYSGGTTMREYMTRTGNAYHGRGKDIDPVTTLPLTHTPHVPYQLVHKVGSYQAGISRTLDKCEDRCVQVIHPSHIWAEQQSEWESIIRVKYIGSFSVNGEDQNARAEYVRKQLLEMRNVTKTKPVLLVISLSGVKVCSATGESVYMAHALKRISYATCDPDNCQFSFLAREPKGHTNIQYCHAFVTKSPQEAEELNAIVGNAFKMAFTHQVESQKQEVTPQQPVTPESAESVTSPPTNTQKQPTFLELIEQQIVVQREQNDEIVRRQQEELTKRLSEISTTKIDERMKDLMERKKKEQEEQEKEQEAQRLQRLRGKDRTSWAKHVAGRVKHKSPLRTPIQSGMGDPQSKHTSSPQSNRQSTATSSNTNGSNQTNSSNTTNTKQSPFTSISALRDAFSAGELRSYGSPVMTLKETIDKIPWSGDFVSNRMDIRNSHGSNSSQDFVDYGEGSGGPNSPDPGASCSQASPAPDFSQRPLPATPPEIHRRTKTKGQKSANQKSPPQADEYSPGQSSRPQSNGHVQSTSSQKSRPLSGKYQNESPMHNRVVETEDLGTLYQGPPTPLRRNLLDNGEDLVYENQYAEGFDSLRPIERNDALIEEGLKNAPWYQAGIPREIALEMLSQEEIGSFVVRDSTTHPGCYALSVKVPKFDNPSGISHYLIMRTTQGGVRLKGLDKEWSSLMSLVTHHTVMRELLPCPLRLPHTANNPAFKDDDKSCEQEEDEDYQRLADFSHMMQDLKM